MTLLPAESLVAPVDGYDDLFRFRYDFELEGKALDTEVVTEQKNGDLIIEGLAAVFQGIDREGENFAPGAFKKGIKSFLESQAALCFHHKHDQILGKVLNLEESTDGLKMTARVDGAIKTHPVLGTYYQQIKNGTLNGLSVGGFFKRAQTTAGPKISEMDFTEISVTGVPVHTGPSFSVVAGKALASDLKPKHVELPEFPEDEMRDEDFEMASYAIDSLDRLFENLKKRQPAADVTTV